MTGNRHKNAWIWLAVAAIAVATLARAEAGLPKAAALTHPVLEFLSAHANSDAFTTASGHRGGRFAGVRREPSGNGAGAWTVLLPIFFIGLVAPLDILSRRVVQRSGCARLAAGLPHLFQRPPPLLLSSL
jgi:hypothetical protein